MKDQTFPLTKKQVKPILAATFPQYNGRKFKLVLTESVEFYDTNWSGGTCNRYQSIRSDGFVLNLRAPAPWNNFMEGQNVNLPKDALVVKWAHFCGKDCGITIYAHPDNAPKFLPAKVEEPVVEAEIIEEYATCPVCSGEAAPLGSLGSRKYFRCVRCGAQFSQ
jgi:hypothetical protein